MAQKQLETTSHTVIRCFGALWILHPRTPTGPPKAPVLSEKRPGDRRRCPWPVARCPLPVPGAPGGQNFDRPKMAQKQLKTTSHTVIRCFGALWTLHPRTPTGPPKAPVLSEKRPGDRGRCKHRRPAVGASIGGRAKQPASQPASHLSRRVIPRSLAWRGGGGRPEAGHPTPSKPSPQSRRRSSTRCTALLRNTGAGALPGHRATCADARPSHRATERFSTSGGQV